MKTLSVIAATALSGLIAATSAKGSGRVIERQGGSASGPDVVERTIPLRTRRRYRSEKRALLIPMADSIYARE